MIGLSAPCFGLFALAFVALAALCVVAFHIKVRTVSRRWLGFRVYDWNADLQLPSPLRSRSYQIALYLTMKSLPRETGAPIVTSPAASPPSGSRATRAA